MIIFVLLVLQPFWNLADDQETQKLLGDVKQKSCGSHEKELLEDIGLSLSNKLEDCIDGSRDNIWLTTRRWFFRSHIVFSDVSFDFSSTATIVLGLPLCRASHMNMMWPPAMTGFHNLVLSFATMLSARPFHLRN